MSNKQWKPLSRLDIPGLLKVHRHRPVALYHHTGESYRLVTDGICLGWMYRLLAGDTSRFTEACADYRRGLDTSSKDKSSLYIVVKVHHKKERREFVENLLPEYLRPYWTTLEEVHDYGPDEQHCLSVIEVHPDLKPVEVGLLYQTLRTSWEHRGYLEYLDFSWSPVIQRLFWATNVAQGGHSPWVYHSSAARAVIAVHGLGAVMDYYKKTARYKYSEQCSSWDWYWGDGKGPSDWSIGEKVTGKMGPDVPCPGFTAQRGRYKLSTHGMGTFLEFVRRDLTTDHPYYEETMALYEELNRQQDSSPRSHKERKS